jgi:hypothetical protein
MLIMRCIPELRDGHRAPGRVRESMESAEGAARQ